MTTVPNAVYSNAGMKGRQGVPTDAARPEPAPAGSSNGELWRVLAVASLPRFRASTRLRLRTSARQAMFIVMLAGVVNAVVLLPGHPAEAIRLVTANLLPTAGALAAYLWLARRRSAPAAGLTIGVLLVVDLAVGMVAGISPDVARLSAGYILLLPPAVALLVPWSTHVHIAWLAMHAAACALIASSVPFAATLEGPKIVMGLLLVASTISVLGHVSNLRARVESFRHIQQIRSMNREMRRRDSHLSTLNARLEQATLTDHMTGLGNRAALEHQLLVVRHRIARYGERYALLMVDVDRFKRINDSLGHVAGDEVLRRVARALATASRTSDSAYRFGGDEFVAVLTLADRASAATVAERIRSGVERLQIPHPDNTPFGVVTVSVGGCVLDRDRLDVADDGWLLRADDALLEVKRAGRNRAAIA